MRVDEIGCGVGLDRVRDWGRRGWQICVRGSQIAREGEVPISGEEWST